MAQISKTRINRNRKIRLIRRGVRETRRIRADFKQYQDLIASPHNFGEIAPVAEFPLSLPANIRLGVSASLPLDLGALEVTVGETRSFSHPSIGVNEVHRGIFAEERKEVSISTNIPLTGDVYLWAIDDLGTAWLIGTGTATGVEGTNILLESGFSLLAEDGGNLLLEQNEDLLLETGDELLTESGDIFVQE